MSSLYTFLFPKEIPSRILLKNMEFSIILILKNGIYQNKFRMYLESMNSSSLIVLGAQ
jgi:hypothetical protein